MTTELDALWRMSIDELQEIIDDNAHPLNENANLVAAQAMQPILDAVKDMVRPLSEGLLAAQLDHT